VPIVDLMNMNKVLSIKYHIWTEWLEEFYFFMLAS